MSSSYTHCFKELIDTKSFSIDLIDWFKILALAFITLFILEPLTDPGHIALTRILNFPNSIAKVLVIPIKAHLLAAYGDLFGKPSIPAVEEILTTDPNFDFLINGIAYLVK